MGADIHVYPEHAHGSHWRPLASRCNPGRDYDLFAKIAGVRGDGQMYPTRGLPEKVGYAADGDNTLYLTDTGKEEGCASRVTAERWVREGSSRFTDEKQNAVTHPDWHSHTWLTPAEFRAVLEAERPSGWVVAAPYWGLLAMLEEVERRGNQARLVIWFDN